MKRLISLALALLLVSAGVQAQGDTLPPELNAQLDDLVTISETLRELDTLVPVARHFPTREETIAYLSDVYDTDISPQQLARLEAFYRALGIIPRDASLRDTYLRLLGAQVGGFYDPDTGVMNVLPMIGDDVGDHLSISEQIIFVHEYTHALQDQHFDLSVLDSPEIASSPDRTLAALALIEGDATAAMNLYTQMAMLNDPSIAFSLLAEGAMSGTLMLPPDTPEGLGRELIFPYDTGLAFVLAVYNAGGRDAVNAAFSDLPVTTEQILHPEKYLDGETGITLEGLNMPVSEGADLLWDLPLGEYYLREWLRYMGVEFSASRAAAGWGGDQFRLWQEENGDLVWSLHSAWDTLEDADQFAEAVASISTDIPDAVQLLDGQGSCWPFDGQWYCFLYPPQFSLPTTFLTSAPTLEQASAPLISVAEGGA